MSNRASGWHWITDLAVAALAVAGAAGFAAVGHRPAAVACADDWCESHSVPESACVECNEALLPRAKVFGWCGVHGLHECVVCHPELAQTPTPAVVSAAERERIAAALRFAPRGENNSRCRQHTRRVQIASAEMMVAIGLGVAPVTRGAVVETAAAPAEIVHDPTRVVRVAARAAGSVRRVLKQLGDRVAAGDVLAVVESPDVGRLRAEQQSAAATFAAKGQTLAAMRDAPGAVAAKNLLTAEADVEDARVRLLAAGQALANLGLPATADPWSADVPVVAPFAGEVVARAAGVGDLADPTKPLFTVADTSRLMLVLKARPDDATRLKPGQPVRFAHGGHSSVDEGTVVAVSPAADEATRTVAVRATLPNPSGRHHAGTFGRADVVLREDAAAVVAPAAAVHWEGDCHVAFVRDKQMSLVFHVRKVRVLGRAGDGVEVVGLLPGEVVATANSIALVNELLRGGLGEGCACHKH